MTDKDIDRIATRISEKMMHKPCQMGFDHDEVKNTLRIRQKLTKAKFDQLKVVSTRKNKLIECLNFLYAISTVNCTNNHCIKCDKWTEGIWWYGRVISICYDCAEMIYLKNYRSSIS